MMLREIHHRAKNILQNISLVLSFEGSHAKSNEAREIIAHATERLKLLAEIQATLSTAYSDDSRIPMADYLSTLCTGICRGSRSPAGQINLDIQCSAFRWPPEQAEIVGLIVSETLFNTCKHAFPPHDASGTFVLRLATVSDNLVELRMLDDGAGFDMKESRNGLGMQLVSSFAITLSGQLRMVSRPHLGTCTIVSFPLPSER